MDVIEAIKTRRSIRKFSQTPILEEDLLELIDCARLAAYPANVQPIKFALVTDPARLQEIFPCTKWAGYLENGAPDPEHRPVAYIALLGDRNIKKNGEFQVETGAAGMTVTLAAMERGIASCWLGALDREKLREILKLPENLVMLDLIALGFPAQHSHAEPMENGDVKYWMDDQGEVHVPKRGLEQVMLQSE